jgi:pimeloyl-ACP methyl ester carboxylesterase
MKTIAILAAAVCLSLAGPSAAQTADPDGACVVLLHGLARTSSSMQDMAEALGAAGYRTANVDYPSTEKPIEKLAMTAIPFGLSQCRRAGAKKIHFVTHSMGGLLLRYYLTQQKVPELGRTVMLSPPNQGSEVADKLKDTAVYQWVNGPAGQQLGTGPDGIARHLPPVDYPVGIITGSEASFFDAPFSKMIPGEDDGKVAVERARVEGMAEFLLLPYGHTFIMGEEEVISEVLYFLEHGKFQKQQESGVRSQEVDRHMTDKDQ